MLLLDGLLFERDSDRVCVCARESESERDRRVYRGTLCTRKCNLRKRLTESLVWTTRWYSLKKTPTDQPSSKGVPRYPCTCTVLGLALLTLFEDTPFSRFCRDTL